MKKIVLAILISFQAFSQSINKPAVADLESKIVCGNVKSSSFKKNKKRNSYKRSTFKIKATLLNVTKYTGTSVSSDVEKVEKYPVKYVFKLSTATSGNRNFIAMIEEAGQNLEFAQENSHLQICLFTSVKLINGQVYSLLHSGIGISVKEAMSYMVSRMQNP